MQVYEGAILIVIDGVDGEFVVGAEEGVDFEGVEGCVIAEELQILAVATFDFDDTHFGGVEHSATASLFLRAAPYEECRDCQKA